MSYWKSTIGQKQIMGLTGLVLSLFVLGHVSGNFLLFLGPEAYNTYSHMLVSNPLIEVVEIGLLVIFVLHFYIALTITLKNKRAKPIDYKIQASGEKKTSFSEKTLWTQGFVVFVFVILHLITFKYGAYYEVKYEGVVMRDLFSLIVDVFQDIKYVIFYVLCLIILTFHLNHGLHSSLASLGFYRSKHEKKVKTISLLFSLFIGIGFILQPLYVFFVL